MSKKDKQRQNGGQQGKGPQDATKGGFSPWLIVVLALGAIGAVALIRPKEPAKTAAPPAANTVAGAPTSSPATSAAAPASPAAPVSLPIPPSPVLTSNEVATSLMVVQDLDFGGAMPSAAEAVAQIERVSLPDDKQGRCFAILDARGESSPDDPKKYRLSMHLSMEIGRAHV